MLGADALLEKELQKQRDAKAQKRRTNGFLVSCRSPNKRQKFLASHKTGSPMSSAVLSPPSVLSSARPSKSRKSAHVGKHGAPAFAQPKKEKDKSDSPVVFNGGTAGTVSPTKSPVKVRGRELFPRSGAAATAKNASQKEEKETEPQAPHPASVRSVSIRQTRGEDDKPKEHDSTLNREVSAALKDKLDKMRHTQALQKQDELSGVSARASRARHVRSLIPASRTLVTLFCLEGRTVISVDTIIPKLQQSSPSRLSFDECRSRIAELVERVPDVFGTKDIQDTQFIVFTKKSEGTAGYVEATLKEQAAVYTGGENMTQAVFVGGL
eukprot:CAMPEP_0177638200 /NCGR_PEP_ID=MMETSP0447-20121125/5364_1 /TAXON_ID=0 /ORGANISM="Stygamoeba regulata, Strain BSH-02190019" /LENGTH=324 /DNA_ID=CAMNT_0019140151 /DNA_START=86 /DNA_END=1060 /DNA_ORIENTATION=+